MLDGINVELREAKIEREYILQKVMKIAPGNAPPSDTFLPEGLSLPVSNQKQLDELEEVLKDHMHKRALVSYHVRY